MNDADRSLARLAVTEAPKLKAVGSVLSANVTDAMSPIGYGYDRNLGVYFSGGPVLESGTKAVLGTETPWIGFHTYGEIAPIGAPIDMDSPERFTYPRGKMRPIIVVSGTEPFSYQWQQDGVDIPGATKATLTVSNLQPNNVSGFVAVVTNVAGRISSQPARVAVV